MMCIQLLVLSCSFACLVLFVLLDSTAVILFAAAILPLLLYHVVLSPDQIYFN